MLGYDRRGLLTVAGLPARILARRFGTPLYVYSAAAVVERFEKMREAFSLRPPLVCYALKANANAAVCRLLARRGAGADIVSGGELERAVAAGFAPKTIVFSGVGKTMEEMAAGVRRGVLAFNVESEQELGALEVVARRLGRKAPVSIRLNPDVDAGTHPHITTGRAENKFGVEPKQALALYAKAVRSRWLTIKGIQCHIGSQVASPAPYERAARAVARVLEALARRGTVLELADLGGGFAVAYGPRERTLKPKVAARAFERALAPWPGVKLVIEPGRWLVADAGALLTRVLYEKTTSRGDFLIVDAGMNDLARPALYGAAHPIWPGRRAARGGRSRDVVGPICESGDFLARGVRLGARAGDLLAVAKAGAYGFSMSSQYNSRPRAAEVLVEDGRARLVRRRETISDLIAAERP